MSAEVPPVDARGPRFGAWVTVILAAGITVLDAVRTNAATASFGWFAYQPLAGEVFVPGLPWAVSARSLAERWWAPAFILLVVLAALLLWTALSPRTQPVAALYRTVIAPRLRPPVHLVDPRGVRLSAAIGLAVAVVGGALTLLGVPSALILTAAILCFGAFLHAAMGLCIGCLIVGSAARRTTG